MKLKKRWSALEGYDSFSALRRRINSNFAAIEEETELALGELVVNGSYIGACGEGTETKQEITLGFRPKAVLIYPQNGDITDTSGRKYGALLTASAPAGYRPASTWAGQLTETGFQCKNDSFYLLNFKDKLYTYLAIGG